MQLPVTAVIPTMSNTAGLAKLLAELKNAGIPAIVQDNSVKNLGFARAVNEVVQQAKTEWVLILNDDVEGVTDNLVNQLISESVNQRWCAIVPVLKIPTGELENIGYSVLPIGKVELNFDPTKFSSEDLDGITAACLLIKREIFQVLGGFDEAFFAYLEDVDLCLRLKERGYRFGVATDLSVIHHHQTTANKMPKKVAWLNMINWWRIVFKHPKKFILSPALPWMLVERGRNYFGLIKTS